MVSHRLQGRRQLSSSHHSCGKFSRGNSTSSLHYLQHNCHRWSMEKAQPQIRPHVQQKSICTLVCRRRWVIATFSLESCTQMFSRCAVDRPVGYCKVLCTYTNIPIGLMYENFPHRFFGTSRLCRAQTEMERILRTKNGPADSRRTSSHQQIII